jgi:monofunctional biosynthetic peptidoglycan transglycosylase
MNTRMPKPPPRTVMDRVQENLHKMGHYAKEIVMSPIRFIRFLCFSIGAFVLFFNTVLAIIIFNFFNQLPDIDKKSFKDFKLDATLRVHKKFDKEKDRKRYFWTPIEKINRELLYAVVMSEDSTYFKHNGVNFNAMIDSLARNIRKREYETGASTITQQVVKNVYLSNEKSIIRKIKEIFIARDLESKFTKNEILEVYLNIVEVGPELYGVGMGSFNMFQKHPRKMNAKEGAFLALMLPSPRKYYFSIYNNKYISKKHRRKMDRILRDMRFLEYLSPKQYIEYKDYPIFK